jgi:hypothetical protein
MNDDRQPHSSPALSNDAAVDPAAENRLVEILRREGFFRRRTRRTWLTAAAAAMVFFLLGLATGVRIAGHEAPQPTTTIEPAQPSAESPSQTKGVIWF